MMGTLLLPLLQARGLDLSMSVGIGMIVGPSQVGARFVEMLAGRRYSPIWTMVASVVLVAVAATMLLASFPLVAITIALYGAGNGIGSIARGTVPLALFGAERFPILMGRLALPLMIAMAVPEGLRRAPARSAASPNDATPHGAVTTPVSTIRQHTPMT